MYSDRTVLRDVSVVFDHMEFLCVSTNDPCRQYLCICDIVDSFEFPTLSCCLPFTLLCRLVIQRLISKIRPWLAFQPLLRSDAQSLNLAIARKVHSYLHFPFPFNSQLLGMPFDLAGFGFPSISRLNDSAAFLGLLHNLNHHLPLFSDLASISLADWTCVFAHCHSPFNVHSLSFSCNFSRLSHKLPHSWLLVHNIMKDLNLSIHDTDVSYLLSGHVSLQHLAHLSSSPTPPSLSLLRNLHSAGFSYLHEIGSWSDTPSPHLQSFHPRPDLPPLLQYTLTFPHISSLTSWLSSLTLSSLTYGFPSLAIPRHICQQHIQNDLLSLSSSFSSLPRLPTSSSMTTSDASMLPSPVSPLDFRTVTFASLSSSHSFCGLLAPFGRSATILHGELYGILVATLFAQQSPPSTSSTLYSDHLNAINFLNDALLTPPPSHSWSSIPACSLYRWILSILSTSSPPLSLHHIQAHTNTSDPPSRANALTDSLASSSSHPSTSPTPVPLPTFTMDKYTPFLPPFQYIDSNLPSLLANLLAHHSYFHPSFSPSHILSSPLYDTHPYPLHPYTRTSSSFSAVVQLYAHSSQLPTNLTLATRFQDRLILCRFGCPSIEDIHHIFVHCPSFNTLRDEYSTLLISDTSRILRDTNLPPSIHSHVDCVTKHVFTDHSSWPLASSRFYLGVLPPLTPDSPSSLPLSSKSSRFSLASPSHITSTLSN